MNTRCKFPMWAVACVGACLSWAAAAQTTANGCEQAWANYNEFKQHNVMEPSQYALTVHGAAVRAACGAEALPVPPGSDTPLLPILRKKTTPVKPPEKPKPPKPPTP
jgi:hypothetical protein